jgi:hypothetical protein
VGFQKVRFLYSQWAPSSETTTPKRRRSRVELQVSDQVRAFARGLALVENILEPLGVTLLEQSKTVTEMDL